MNARPGALWLVAALAAPGGAPAQAARDVNLPLAPPSPAFVLMGGEPASVERPGNVTDFALSIFAASGGLSALPRDYALAVAPYWLAGARNVSYGDYAKGGTGGAVFLQTFMLSVAAQSSGSDAADTLTSLGLGVRFSLVRGPIDTAAQGYGARLDTLYGELDAISRRTGARFVEAVSDDTVMARLRRLPPTPESQALLKQRQDEIVQELEGASAREAARVRRLASSLAVHRLGWNIDIAAGTVFDFPGRVAKNGRIGRLGVWMNGGYESRGLAFLGVARLLRDERSAEPTSVDVGARLVANAAGRYGISGEAVARVHPNSDTLQTGVRLALITDIRLGKNRAVSLTFGRDFDGSRTGSLLAAINLIVGLVTERALEAAAEP